MSIDINFERGKIDILKDIQNGVDWSPKGSIDAPVRELVTFINNLPDYVTTSSCSGRISCFRDNNRTKGIEWLLVKHRTITLHEIYSAVQCKDGNEVPVHTLDTTDTTNITTATPMVMLKCEPFILHVQCRSVASAQQLHRLGMNCGFRESGIGLGQRKTMVAIRTTAFSMELPVALGDRFILNEAAIRIVVSECNRKLLANFARIDRLLQHLKDEYVWPIFRSESLFCPVESSIVGHEDYQVSPNLVQYRDQAFYGHTSCLIQRGKDGGGSEGEGAATLVTVGGSCSTGRSIHPHSLSLSTEQLCAHKVQELTVSPVIKTVVHATSLTCPVILRGVQHTSHVFVLDPVTSSTGQVPSHDKGEKGVNLEDISVDMVNRRFQLVLVSGGRRSPVQALPAIQTAFLCGTSETSSSRASALHSHEVSVLQEGDVPSPRWGHAIAAYDSRRWIVTGGRDGGRVFGDAYVLEIIPTLPSCELGTVPVAVDSPLLYVTFQWTKLKADLPLARFFHASCSTQNASLVLSGGLGESALNGDPSPVTLENINDAFVLTLPSFAEDSSCLYDEVDDIRVETPILAAKLRWSSLKFHKEQDIEALSPFTHRFGHTMTYIGANSIAVIGGSTFATDFETDNETSANIVEVWDMSTVDPSLCCPHEPEGKSWSKFSQEEVHCDFTVSVRHVEVDTTHTAGHFKSLVLGVGDMRCHHQSLLQENVNNITRTIDTQLIITGGGLDCPALFGSQFSPSLSLRITSQYLTNSELKSPSTSSSKSEIANSFSNCTAAAVETKTTCLVILIPKSRVRGVKVFLEANNWLDKGNRITPAVKSLDKSVQLKCSLKCNRVEVRKAAKKADTTTPDEEMKDIMAVPVTSSFFQMLSASTFNGDINNEHVTSLISIEDYAALYALLVLPIPETTETASERKKKSKAKKSANCRGTSKADNEGTQPLQKLAFVADNESDSLHQMCLLFSEQDCNLNKTKIASFGATKSSQSAESQQKATDQPENQSLSQSSKKKIEPTREEAVSKQNPLNAMSETCLVILVPKSRVRGVKVFLDGNKWLDKGNRISPVVVLNSGSKGEKTVVRVVSSLSTVGHEAAVFSQVSKVDNILSIYSDEMMKDIMAVPVTSSFFQLLSASTFNGDINNEHVTSLISIEDYAALYALLVLPIPETTETASERKKKSKAKKTLQSSMDSGQAQSFLNLGTESLTNISLVFTCQPCSINKVKAVSAQVKAIEYVQSFISKFKFASELERSTFLKDIPTKFEIIGDVVMISEGCLEHSCWKSVINESFWMGLLHCFNHSEASTSSSNSAVSMKRDEGKAPQYSRVARKARIDPGLKRESRVRLLYPLLADTSVSGEDKKQDKAGPGCVGWTEVTENGITYGFDITKVMFCSGNVTERMRMGGPTRRTLGEVIVDLYAGIGYYTIPFLVHGGASCVHACEWNPNSTTALRANLLKAGVNVLEGNPLLSKGNENAIGLDTSHEGAEGRKSDKAVCIVYEGDNSITARVGGILDSIADRVSLGLIPSSVPGWPLGVTVLKQTGGMLHVHENVKDDQIDQWVKATCIEFEQLFEFKKSRYSAEEQQLYGHYTMVVRCIHLERVKSYAPHLYHVVADLECTGVSTAI